ncbi:MAG: ABC transporter substrate-binding protein [Actinomycetota bacterium]
MTSRTSRTSRSSRGSRLIAGLLTLGVLIAACGSDDAAEDSTDSATEAASQADQTESEATAADEPGGDEPDGDDGTGSSTDGAEADIEADEASEEAADDAKAPSDAPDDELRVVQTSFGEVEVPANPERVVALDAVAAMNLISVGVEPTTVFDINGAETVRNVLTERGIALRSDLGDGFSELNYEAVAVEDPDLIIIVAVDGFENLTGPLAEIAPTIVMPFFSTWDEAMRDTGALFEREAEAEAVIAGLEQRFAEVGETVAADPYSLSILGSGLGFLLAMSPDAAISLTADGVGVSRPDAQVGDIEPFMGQPAFQVSEELLADHDADIVAVLDGQFYDSAAVRSIPTFDNLGAAQAGNVFNVDGDMWFTGHPFAVFWQLADLESLALGGGAEAMGTVDDSLERWDDYLALAGA